MNAERQGPSNSSRRSRPASRRSEVTISSHPLWRLTLAERLPRSLLYLTATAGLLASARFAIAPPSATSPVVKAAPPVDMPGQSFASLFARAYLTWEAADPEARQAALSPFTGSNLEPEAGLQPPSHGSQHVLWEQVVQERPLQPRGRMYTIAVDTDALGLLYLTVPVVRSSGGALSLAGYPAFVGAPDSTEASGPGWGGTEVEDQALSTVVERALRNYLTPAPAELAADLAAGAKVSPPQLRLSLESVQSLTWAVGGRSVVAVVTASGGNGSRWTLTYEVDVLRSAGRWEVSAIQMDPDA